MMKFLIFLCIPFLIFGNLPPPVLEDPMVLIVHNRILTKIQDKTISVLDVVKKMDLFLNEYYPEHATSKIAKYQFYVNQWRDTLNQLIDNELMVLDAESREIKVSDGEIREEIQQRFGPNVMGTLHQLNLSYEEARKLVHHEMIAQRMHWFRVTSKALQKVTSLDIKEAYQTYCQSHPPKEEWEYQVASFRSTSAQLSQRLAEKVSSLLKLEGVTLEASIAELPSEETQEATVNLSPVYKADEKTLSTAHREILTKLISGAFSAPILQQSKDGSSVVRIFHLKSYQKTELPSFEKMANQLKDDLLHQAANKEMSSYVSRLRNRFGYDEKSLDIPPNFQPFELLKT